MSNIAVKLFSHVADAPVGIPVNWPAETVDLGESTALPEGEGWILMTESELTAHKATYQSEYNTFTYSINIRRTVDKNVTRAIVFGQNLVKDFAVENVMMGITQSGKTNQVRKATQEVISALSTGSLYDAIHEARQIPQEQKDDTFVTDARLLVFINKIESFLGLPLSTSL